ncbi:putative flippase GtrA [Nakamurella sp. UYEF19]|uniref:GtrA family protein n=1 Tax=Nakamurella sp. UYEF19 TaxID=1756392 RepID=UPI0033978223
MASHPRLDPSQRPDPADRSGRPLPSGSPEPSLPEVPKPSAEESDSPGPLLRLIRDQRVAFLIVGGLNTAVGLAGFVFFNSFIHLWGGDVAVLLAQCIAIPFAFVLHRRFVFRVSGHVLRDFSRFVLVNVIPVSVNLAVLPILTKVFGWKELPAQLAFTVVWVVCSYFLHRGFSFRRTESDGVPAPDQTDHRASHPAPRPGEAA